MWIFLRQDHEFGQPKEYLDNKVNVLRISSVSGIYLCKVLIFYEPQQSWKYDVAKFQKMTRYPRCIKYIKFVSIIIWKADHNITILELEYNYFY